MRPCCATSKPWSRSPRGRSGLAAAVVLQEYPDAGGRAAGTWSFRQPHRCRRAATRLRPLPERQRQDAGGPPTSGSGCAVSLYRRCGQAGTAPRTARHLRGYTKKKELVGDLRNGGRTWRTTGDPDRVRVHDFLIRDPGHGKAIPYGACDLRRDDGGSASGLTTTRPALRSTRFAGGGSTWVAARIPTRDRWSSRLTPRQQRPARPALEVGTAAARESGRARHHRLSPPTGDKQVEQDRTSPLFAHRDELARDTAHKPRRHRQPDRLNPQSIGLPRPIRDRSPAICR